MTNTFFSIIFKSSCLYVNDFPNIVILNNDQITLQSFYGFLRFKNKFDTLKLFLSNSFISAEKKELVLEYFSKAQKLNFVFKKFYNNLLLKKMQKSNNDTDLCLVPLSEHNQKCVIKLVQNNTLYKFYIFDLTRIIVNCLSNNDLLISDPIWPTNPYTNLKFSYDTLLMIYFFLLKQNLEVPFLFKQFLDTNLNLKLFFKNNENYLRLKCIKRYYKDMNIIDKYFYVIGMLYDFKSNWQTLTVDIRYPTAKLVEIFESLVYDYIIYKYSYSPIFKTNAKNKIIKTVKNIYNNDFHIGKVYSKYILDHDLILNPRLKFKEIKVCTNVFVDILSDDITEEEITNLLSRRPLNETFYIYTNS